MTVLVNGASGVVGQAVVRRLVIKDEVRATVRRPSEAERLRTLGAKVAIRDAGRVEDLAEILPGVHTLIHLVGGPNQLDLAAVEDANHGSAAIAAEAAVAAGVRRLILVSVPGADPASPDPFLGAKGRAERAVAEAGMDHAIVRSTHVYGLGGLWFTATVHGALIEPPITVGDPDDVLAPLAVGDLAAIIVAIDDRAEQLAGTWALEGPDELAARGLAGMLGAEPSSVVRGRQGQVGDLLGTPVVPTAADHLARTSRADAPDAASAFGVVLTKLDAGLAALIAAAQAPVRG